MQILSLNKFDRICIIIYLLMIILKVQLWARLISSFVQVSLLQFKFATSGEFNEITSLTVTVVILLGGAGLLKFKVLLEVEFEVEPIPANIFEA
jgi:hypothetical protein